MVELKTHSHSVDPKAPESSTMANNKTRILVIDDEIDCLDQIKTSLSSKADQWILEYSNNPLQALESIVSNPPTIVICDYHMPQMNGAELLRKAEKAHPFIHRFIVANRDEIGVLEDGIGSAFHFLPKPCPANRLLTEIQRCLSIEAWLGKTQIKNIVGTLGELPSLPSLYIKIVDVLNDDDVSIEKVGKAISTDITISAKILKIVNSSFFGFDETISDITQAVSVLGIETVKNLVLAIQVFSDSQGGEQKTQTDQLWNHSMNVAVGAKNLMMYETGSSKLAEGAYTSGLFHDIGKLIMQRAAPDAYKSAQEFAALEKIPAWEAENEILGCNHAEAGAYLLARWGLPIEAVESAVFHHEPVNSSGSSFSALASVYVANRILSEKEATPASGYDCPFISGLGKADQWPEWHTLVTRDFSDETNCSGKRAGADLEQPQSKWDSEVANCESPTDFPAEQEVRKPRITQNQLVVGACTLACILFAGFIVTKNTSSVTIDDWEQGSFTSQPNEGTHFENIDENSADDNTITAQELVDQASDTYFKTVTAEELVAESLDPSQEPIKFPKINITKIYHDLPIPVANINSKMVRIGDRVSGARIVDMDQKNVIVQYEGMRKSYSVK